MTLSEDTPFVVFGDDWGRHVSTMQHVFRHIIPRYPVVWVNGIGHRVPQLRAADIRRAWEKAWAVPGFRSAVSLAPTRGVRPLQIVQPHVLPWHHWPGVERANTRQLFRAIQRAFQRAGLEGRTPLIVTGSPPSVGFVERAPALASIYFCMDDFLHHPSATAWMIRPLEERLLRIVDATAATAESLTRLKRPASGLVRHIPQGVNYEHFAARLPEPPDLAVLPRPIIGFAGRLSACIDYDLVRQVASAHVSGSIALVGPCSVPESTLRTIRLPNVHFLGPRPYDDLPSYVQHFDVAIVPYVLNDWTRSVDPLKLLEYLAAGVPVVSTPLPEVRRYAERVEIATDADAFLARIRVALAADREATRVANQALARLHTWQVRADALLELAGEVAERRAGMGAGSGLAR